MKWEFVKEGLNGGPKLTPLAMGLIVVVLLPAIIVVAALT